MDEKPNEKMVILREVEPEDGASTNKDIIKQQVELYKQKLLDHAKAQKQMEEDQAPKEETNTPGTNVFLGSSMQKPASPSPKAANTTSSNQLSPLDAVVKNQRAGVSALFGN